MSATPRQNLEYNIVDASINWPAKYEDAQRVLNIVYRRLAQAINDREIARYDVIDEPPFTTPGFERVTGQIWNGVNDTQVGSFRKVVPFPALAAGANLQPHYIGSVVGYTFTRLDGVLQNAAGSSFASCPNGDGGVGKSASLEVAGANVVITLPGGSPWIGYTALIILEYIKV